MAEADLAMAGPEASAARKRPHGVTFVGWLYIVSGTVGLIYHSGEFLKPGAILETLLVSLVRLLAIVAGIYLLRGRNWARWLVLAWMGYHVVLSAFHTWSEFLMHALIFLALAIYLTRPIPHAFFRRNSSRGGPVESATC